MIHTIRFSQLFKKQISTCIEISKRDDLDLMLNGLVGAAGMAPTLNSVEQGVDVALSNKESLVMAGDLIRSEIGANCTFDRGTS